MRLIISILLFSLLGTSIAQATPISMGLGDASKYNLITRGDALLIDADSQGIIAVGGNASINKYDVGTTTANGNVVLQVDGNLNASGDMIIKGDAIVKGQYNNLSESQSHNPIPQWRNLFRTGGIDIKATFDKLAQFSTALADVTTNATSNISYTQLLLTPQRDKAYLDNLFVTDIHVDELNALTSLNGNLFTDNDYVVFNVASNKNVELDTFDVMSGLPNRQNLLFNFIDAESISFGSGNIHGSILAPKADFVFEKGLITGGLYVNSFTSSTGAQLNFEGGFLGEVPTPALVTTVSEPAGVLILLIGAVALMTSRKKMVTNALSV
jgi:choice-of-anchor A domain-containing protein